MPRCLFDRHGGSERDSAGGDASGPGPVHSRGLRQDEVHSTANQVLDPATLHTFVPAAINNTEA